MAYTYLIGWTKYNKWYYGVRYSKKCQPHDLWKTYFTSSKYVKEFRKDHGEPDIIEIRKTFDSPNEAILWEEKVLKKMNVLNSDKWLNKNVAGAISSDISSAVQLKKVKNGTHPFIGETAKKRAKNTQLKRIKDGTHPFCDSEKQKILSIKSNKNRLKKGTHNLLINNIKEFFTNMTEEEFSIWLSKQQKFGKNGKKNSNVTRAINIRNI
jgi:hypothetical protein